MIPYLVRLNKNSSASELSGRSWSCGTLGSTKIFGLMGLVLLELWQREEMSLERTSIETTWCNLLRSGYWYLIGGPGPSSNATCMKIAGTFNWKFKRLCLSYFISIEKTNYYLQKLMLLSNTQSGIWNEQSKELWQMFSMFSCLALQQRQNGH